MNTKLLRRIQKQILKTPKQFNMRMWFTRDPQHIPNCGTAACIGGWAIALTQKKNPEKARTTGKRDPWSQAMHILGLDMGQAARLFISANWPLAFCRAFRNSPKQAVRRIDHFIKTKGEK